MKFCQSHWNALRDEVKRLGMESLIATSGEQAVAQMVNSLEEGSKKSNFDPLMAAHNMIVAKALDMVGLELLAANEDGSERCPICFLQKCHDDQGKCVELNCVWNEPERVHSFWIEGPVGAARLEAVRLGLLASS